MVDKVTNRHSIAELGKKTQFKKGVKREHTRKGIENVKTKVAREVMLEVLATNHLTGKFLTYKQFRMDMKGLCMKHSMVAKHFLEGYFGKAVERMEQKIQAITIHTDKPITKDTSNTITVDTVKGTVDTNDPIDNSNAQVDTDDRDI